VRLNRLHTALGHKNQDYLSVWESNHLMEWANAMQNTIDAFDNKKLSEIEGVHAQIKSTLEQDLKLRVGNVDLTEKDVSTF